jgi:hypothetical protein
MALLIKRTKFSELEQNKVVYKMDVTALTLNSSEDNEIQ